MIFNQPFDRRRSWLTPFTAVFALVLNGCAAENNTAGSQVRVHDDASPDAPLDATLDRAGVDAPSDVTPARPDIASADTVSADVAPPCQSDRDCASGSARVCDPTSHACVECSTDAHCAAGRRCVRNQCFAGCDPDHPCAAGQSCCEPGMCVNPQVDVNHCGACGRVCRIANGTAGCAESQCTVAACNAGFGDCDASAANGCETPTASNVLHCGGCGRICSSGPHANPVCSAGACQVICDEGWADCDGNPSNGCEVDRANDPSNCGGCGAPAPMRDNAVPTCRMGVGSFTCRPGYADCDQDAANGCEADLNATASCGACGRACEIAHATTRCASGACAIAACHEGFADCDGDASNGCETDVRVSASHCGRCGHVFSTAGGTATCRGGACGIAACAEGRGDCDGNEANGCETDLAGALEHCGACGAVCARANATPACEAGACRVAACNAGWGNCDGSEANGCETPTNSVTHCGACGAACPARPHAVASCAAGACRHTCETGYGDCDGNAENGCETDLSGSLANCGACGVTCSRANASAVCVMGTCSLGMCSPLSGNCDGNPANGCETPLNAPQHCGGCGVVCAPGNVVNADCLTGACDYTVCAGGYGDCDTQRANGCETPLDTVENCGGCGTACVPGSRCVNGTCRSPAPTLTAVSPRVAPPTGGSLMTLTGTNFQPGARVYFYGREATDVRVDSTTRIMVTLPAVAGVCGAAQVEVTNPDGQSARQGGLFAYGFFDAAVMTTTAVSARAVVTADFNNDGRLDVALGGTNVPHVAVFQGLGGGRFGAPSNQGAGFGTEGVVTADFNGDGTTDLLSANRYAFTASLVSGHGDGTFAAARHYFTASGSVAAAAGDLDEDGYPDAVVANSTDNSVSVLVNNTDGTFGTPRAIRGFSGPWGVIVARFDADAHLDMIVSNRDTTSIAFLHGNGDGTFTEPRTIEVGGAGPYGLGAADFDADGFLDVAVALSGGGQVSVLRGSGDGTFHPPALVAAAQGTYAVVAVDINRDRRPDLAVASFTGNSLSYAIGNGDGTFQPTVTCASEARPAALATGDFNGDGRVDLVVGHDNMRLGVLLNVVP
jgi:hypothetical protein